MAMYPEMEHTVWRGPKQSSVNGVRLLRAKALERTSRRDEGAQRW